MEIHIHDLHELALLVSVLDLAKLSDATKVPLRYMPTDNLGHDSEPFGAGVQNVISMELAAPYAAGAPKAVGTHLAGLDKPPADVGPDVLANVGGPVAAASVEPQSPGVDSSGLPWDDRIHSTPAKARADGTWRARRGVSDELVAQVTAELRQAQADAQDAPTDTGGEVVATETHALPVTIVAQSDVTEESSELVGAGAPGLDLFGLVEASRIAAGDASDSLQDLLDHGRDFIGKYGTDAFAELKGTVCTAIESGAPNKPMQALSPGERRLLRACMDNYALYL